MSQGVFDADKIKNQVVAEKETRKRFLTHARILGFEKEMQQLFDKYDKLLKNCKNEQERKDIGKLGAVEAYNLLGRGGELYVDGQLVCKDS